ncbi:MAG: hypothetical protein JXC32_09965 [Anaerolineae bacterium]|nr:hypothetical protein [Anaerolineae bacterium]
MKHRVDIDRSEQTATMLKPEWGYLQQEPPAAEDPGYIPMWQMETDDPAATMAQEFAEAEIRLTELRTHIERLGLTPKGRTRIALATQLAEAYMDPERLASAVGGLTENARHYLARLLLHFRLQDHYVYPDYQTYWRDFNKDWTALAKPLIKAGVLLQEPEKGGLVIPFGIQRQLPQLEIAFPSARSPETVVSAADPHALLGQLQQMMGLLQSGTFRLRPTLRWKAPDYPYAKAVVCWPPVPADARALNGNVERDRMIELLPPEPRPDDAALQAFASTLGVTEIWAEFLYHLLVAIGVLWPGSPLAIDPDLSQAWMAMPPGRQLTEIYRLYRNLTDWASWWPRWRQQSVRLRRTYHGYWGLMSLDESVHLSCSNLRWILLEILSFLPDNVWLSIDDIDRWLHTLFPTPDSHRYLMGLELSCDDGGWPAFLRTVLVDILTGPLFALGLVDIGPSLEEPDAIRLKGLQSVHWGRTEALSLETTIALSQEALRFIPEGPALEIATPVPPDVITLLLRWASPAGFSRTLVRYSLDVGKLHTAFEAGEDPGSLSAAWQACTDFEPPPGLLAWWQTWWERYGHVRLYPPQALLRTRDAMTMQEIQISLSGLQSSITSMLSPAVALLTPDHVDAILEDLARQGYMPKESS